MAVFRTLEHTVPLRMRVRFVSFYGNWLNIFVLTQVTSDHPDRIIHFFEEFRGTSYRLHFSVLNDIKKPIVAAGCRVLGLFSKLVSALCANLGGSSSIF